MARTRKNQNGKKVVIERREVIPEATPPGRRATRGKPNGSNTRGGGRRGSGGYDVMEVIPAPVSVGRYLGQSRPKFKAGGSDGLVYCGTEKILSINTSETFVASVVNLMPHSCPWLNDLACLFSNWRWLKLRFIYIPVCPTSTTGELAMAFQYDVPDPTPTSISQMSQMTGYVNSSMWNGGDGANLLQSLSVPAHSRAVVAQFDINRPKNSEFRYITADNFLGVIGAQTVLGPVAANDYSPGNLVLATEGGPSVNIKAGNLHVQYEIEVKHSTPRVLNY